MESSINKKFIYVLGVRFLCCVCVCIYINLILHFTVNLIQIQLFDKNLLRLDICVFGFFFLLDIKLEKCRSLFI